MQSVFGFHNRNRFRVYCYATTASDHSPYRQKIEREADVFLDVSSWATKDIIERVLQDQIHILINLNGYTKGARNEVFAARPAPVQISYMGFAGTLGAQWTDWFVTDPIVCPQDTVQPELWYKRRQEQHQKMAAGNSDQWVYTERMIYMPHSYFVDDHRQGFREKDDISPGHLHLSDHMTEAQLETRWLYEQDRRWAMRHELFPQFPDDWFIFANFNQLYKIDPIIFRIWIKILVRVPKSIIWLLNFPAAGKEHLTRTALQWHAGDPTVAQRIVFTDVAPKEVHIHRGRVADVFLDTPECNGHTTAVDILWSGTPIVTWPRNYHKLCSRVAASVCLATGLAESMIVQTGQEYEDLAVQLATTVRYDYIPRMAEPPPSYHRVGHGTVMNLRKHLFLHRDTNRLFDTPRWTRNLEKGYAEAWRRWESGEEFLYTPTELTALDPRVAGDTDPSSSLNSSAAMGNSTVTDQIQRANGTFGLGSRGSIYVQDDDDGAMSAQFCRTQNI
ncbi:glycosyl transferase family 41-domain-containing protein [Dimargaris cristalligena]|uniref:Glycosyl transferase family 41-domain-containing protein n=1 Tax=Dimargaris cristalligena TaxID=215637 RepID=A0A4V1J4H8_9FUNG|nr:glycosyl transferase family 41-domain-containing protein [Dimargaris cristalligena]|eukprot:RKP35609.1 glycosyl transferase family 41-domain-containing protein [Dimargaris cristalligena]